jgi:hypothetical protein
LVSPGGSGVADCRCREQPPIIRALIDAGLDDALALWAGLGMLVLVCWFICARIEPAIRRLPRAIISNVRRLPKASPPANRPTPLPGLGLPLPIRAKVNFTGR